VYSNVEDPDGFYGVHSSDIRKSLLLRYHHEGEWSRAFEHHGAAFQTSAPSEDTTRNVLASLEAFGFHRIASHIMTGMREASNSNSSQVDPLEYEVAWRNGNWDLPLSMPNHDLGSEALLYSALRAVHRERETGRALETVRSLIGIEMRRLGALGMESVTHVRDVVKNLLSLREIVVCLQAYETLEKQPLTLPDTCE
jgi:ataxia telangiectasia mutated family protein